MYSYTDFLNQVANSVPYKNITQSLTMRDILNRAVRDVRNEIDLNSLKRLSPVATRISNEIYDYACPSDLDGKSVIDIIPQINRKTWSDWSLCSAEEFDRRKRIEDSLFCVVDRDSIKKLRATIILGLNNENSTMISPLDNVLENGQNWTAVGDATNLRRDIANYVNGSASLEYNIGSGGTTTAGIQHTNLSTFDLTDFLEAGSVYIWAYITSATNLTNFILRLGSDTSNYYQITVTTTNDGSAFMTGWNLLRFDFSQATTTGTPVNASCKYASIYMTKAAGKINENQYRFDMMKLTFGTIFNVYYYSNLPWKSAANALLANSTADTDTLVADDDEYGLYIIKAKEYFFNELREYNQVTIHKSDYEVAKKAYLVKNPSEAKVISSTYREL